MQIAIQVLIENYAMLEMKEENFAQLLHPFPITFPPRQVSSEIHCCDKHRVISFPTYLGGGHQQGAVPKRLFFLLVRVLRKKTGCSVEVFSFSGINCFTYMYSNQALKTC